MVAEHPRARPPQRASTQPFTDLNTSKRLSRIKQRDTGPELAVRRVLHQMGHRYLVRNRDLPGSPDIANRTRRWAIFVHGCFWHRHRHCSRTTTPVRNAAFWATKFKANQRRDRRVTHELRVLGFKVYIIWECETTDLTALRGRLARIANDLSQDRKGRVRSR